MDKGLKNLSQSEAEQVKKMQAIIELDFYYFVFYTNELNFIMYYGITSPNHYESTNSAKVLSIPSQLLQTRQDFVP